MPPHSDSPPPRGGVMTHSPPPGGSHSPEGGPSATPRLGEGGWTPTRPARERPRESPEISRGSKVPRVKPQSQRAEGREDAEPAEQGGRRKLTPPLDRGHTARQCQTSKASACSVCESPAAVLAELGKLISLTPVGESQRPVLHDRR